MRRREAMTTRTAAAIPPISNGDAMGAKLRWVFVSWRRRVEKAPDRGSIVGSSLDSRDGGCGDPP
jgi:hypothetical protein